MFWSKVLSQYCCFRSYCPPLMAGEREREMERDALGSCFSSPLLAERIPSRGTHHFSFSKAAPVTLFPLVQSQLAALCIYSPSQLKVTGINRGGSLELSVPRPLILSVSAYFGEHFSVSQSLILFGGWFCFLSHWLWSWGTAWAVGRIFTQVWGRLTIQRSRRCKLALRFQVLPSDQVVSVDCNQSHEQLVAVS